LNVILSEGQRLCVAFNLSAGGVISTLAITPLTNDAYALAQYLIKTGKPIEQALKESNRRFTDQYGFDIVTTWPLDFSDPLNIIGAAPTLGHFAGLVSAAKSEQMLTVGKTNFEQPHQPYTSMLYNGLTYADLLHDGIYNGQAASGLLSLGKVAMNTQLLRHDMVSNMFVAIASEYNAIGMTASDISEFAMHINNSTDLVYSGAEIKPLELNTPVVTNLSIIEGQTLSQDVLISADIVDLYGVYNVKFFLGNTELIPNQTDANYSFNLNTRDYIDGDYSLSIVATNLVGGNTIIPVFVEISNNLIEISNIQPPNASNLRGVFDISANVTDVLPITKVSLLLDGVLLDNLFNPNNFTTTVDTIELNLPDGSYTFTIRVENSGGYNVEKTVNYTIDNTAPVLFFTNMDSTTYFSDEGVVCFESYDEIAIGSTEIFFDGSSMGHLTDNSIKCLSIDVSSFPEKNYTMTISNNDMSGNITTLSMTVYIDRSLPNVDFYRYSTDIIPISETTMKTANNNISFAVKANDQNEIKTFSIVLKVNGADIVIYDTLPECGVLTNTTTITKQYIKNDGIYELVATTTDNAGRTKSVSLFVDNIVTKPFGNGDIGAESCGASTCSRPVTIKFTHTNGIDSLLKYSHVYAYNIDTSIDYTSLNIIRNNSNIVIFNFNIDYPVDSDSYAGKSRWSFYAGVHYIHGDTYIPGKIFCWRLKSSAQSCSASQPLL